jgi:thiosulfate/3-mercaptopyruvate sulfurtransferase
MNSRKHLFYITISDIQTVAQEKLNRKLSKGELATLSDKLIDKVQWYEPIEELILSECKKSTHSSQHFFKIYSESIMNKVIIIFLLCAFVACYPQQSTAQSNTPTIFVTTSWLAEHLNDSSIVVIQVAPIRRDYERGHLPGSRFLWVGWMALSNPELSYEMLPVEQLDTLLEGLGVSNDSRIILCGTGANVGAVARVFATLDYLGMGDKTSILDGGIDAWKSEGRPVTKEISAIKRSSFTPHIKQGVFVDAEFVKSNLNKPGFSVIDLRQPNIYKGLASSGYSRNGRIPGAININSTTLVDSTNKLLPLPKLVEIFNVAGVKEGNDVVTYCNIGASASTGYVVARYLGYNAHLYDGSFEDWSSREELPIEIPAKQDSTKKQ